MGVRVYLDSTLLADTPKGWDEAKIKSVRDDEVRGLFTTYTTDLDFWGDGFDYIDNIMNNDYCQTIDVLIESDDCTEGVWRDEFNGVIQLTQISKMDIDKRIVTTKILDESFDAKIDNNKSIKAIVTVGTSKNDVSITPVTAQQILIFDPTDNFNVYEATPAYMYRVYDCFRFIIDYMTDGTVDFVSDVFSGDYYNWMLCTGSELRQRGNAGEKLEISFKEVFKELHKKTNLSLAIEPNAAGYTNQFRVRIEPTEYFEQDDAIITLESIRGIDLDFNKTELYSNIEVGSKEFDDDVILSYPPINFKAFKKEDFTILGQCNIDKTLNLVSNYIIDTNIIEYINLNGADTKYDKKTFLIVTDGTKAIKYKEYGEPLSIGVNTSVSANKLIDSTADFSAAGDNISVGDMVINVDTDLNANVNSVDSPTQLTLDTDIFTLTGENYQIRTQPYSYNHPLTNIEVVKRFIGGLPNSVIKHISTSSIANFWAGQTVTNSYTSFPLSVNPMEYDDDTTPPFFDDATNYDTTLFQYTVPSSGLYGFEANAAIILNGQLDTANSVANGDFSTQLSWDFGAGSIGGGKYSIGVSWQYSSLAYLRQVVFSGYNKYYLTFDCTIVTGSITVVGGQTVTTSGTYTQAFDFSTIASPDPHLRFNFNMGTGGNVNATIDNVTLYRTPRFDITQTIVRSNSAGVPLQTFTTSERYNLNYNEFQRTISLQSQRTFSTFLGEKITIKLDVVNVSGSGTQLRVID